MLLAYVLVACIVSVLLVKLFNDYTKGALTSNKCLVGKTVLITGGNSGIGYEAVLNLASRGCRLIIASRSANELTCKRIMKATGNENVTAKQLDLSSFASIRRFAAEIKRSETKLDVLINNSGTAGMGAGKTADGCNAVMQTNHFGPFLLTHLLLDLLKKASTSSPASIVFTSSILAYTHHLTIDTLIDPFASVTSNDYRPNWLIELIAYSNSKLCNILIADQFAQRLANYAICVQSCHPGLVDTTILQNGGMLFFPSILRSFWMFLLRVFVKTAREGAEILVETALNCDDRKNNGRYVFDNVSMPKPSIAYDKTISERVWKMSERVVRLEDELKLTGG